MAPVMVVIVVAARAGKFCLKARKSANVLSLLSAVKAELIPPMQRTAALIVIPLTAIKAQAVSVLSGNPAKEIKIAGIAREGGTENRITSGILNDSLMEASAI